MALLFLDSIGSSTRGHILHIVLREDFESVASPECHGRGFIFVCTENPSLRVERYVSLWQIAFPVKPKTSFEYLYGMFGDMHIPAPDWLSNDAVFAKDLTSSVGTWITEALLLPSLGMPANCYTLVLDGDPIPEKTTLAFNVVQRDAAWQVALDLCYSRGILPEPSWLDRRLRTGYMFESLPDAMKNISKISPLIRCNFDVGSAHDPEALVEEHNGWSLEKWEKNWVTHEVRRFETEPPLPSWHELRWQRVLPV